MTNAKLILILAVALLAAGCASSRCTGELEYQNAQSMPLPSKVEGLKLGESPSSMKIPPPPANPVPYAAPAGDDKFECLDVPPQMPPENPDAPEGGAKS
jgi:hypothetical protein